MVTGEMTPSALRRKDFLHHQLFSIVYDIIIYFYLFKII